MYRACVLLYGAPTLLAKNHPALHLPILSSVSALTSVSSTSHLSALTTGMSLFAPGFAITTTALDRLERHRAYPFLDEDLVASAGSRYPCFLVKIHQLDSAKCRATAVAALP